LNKFRVVSCSFSSSAKVDRKCPFNAFGVLEFSLDVFSVLPYCSSTPQDYTQVHMGEDKTAQWLVSVATTKRSLSSHDVLSGCLRSEKFFSLLQQIFYGQGSD
jgi:hypothetical protein